MVGTARSRESPRPCFTFGIQKAARTLLALPDPTGKRPTFPQPPHQIRVTPSLPRTRNPRPNPPTRHHPFVASPSRAGAVPRPARLPFMRPHRCRGRAQTDTFRSKLITPLPLSLPLYTDSAAPNGRGGRASRSASAPAGLKAGLSTGRVVGQVLRQTVNCGVKMLARLVEDECRNKLGAVERIDFRDRWVQDMQPQS